MAALVHAGPKAVLTAFTAAQAFGPRGWERDTVRVLAPGGTRLRRECPVPVRPHLARDWATVVMHRQGGVPTLPDALLRAAATFGSARTR